MSEVRLKNEKCGLLARARSLKTFLVHREGDKKTEGTQKKINKRRGRAHWKGNKKGKT